MLTKHITIPDGTHLVTITKSYLMDESEDWIVVCYPGQIVVGSYATREQAEAVRDELRTRVAVLKALTS